MDSKLKWGRLCGGLLWLTLLLVSPAASQSETASAAKLDASGQADLARIEAYFNQIKTLKAGFLQVSSNGGVASGKLYLSRPGRMRFEYDPPTPILMVTDGLFLVYIDRELEQVTHIWLNSTPVGFLVRDRVALTKDVTVTGFERRPGLLRVTLADTKTPEKGSLTLIFGVQPLALRKWTVVDAQGIATTVSLTGIEIGLALDPELFIFREDRDVKARSP